MLLSDLPVDILEPVPRLLIGNDIAKLMMTGSAPLRIKLHHTEHL